MDSTKEVKTVSIKMGKNLLKQTGDYFSGSVLTVLQELIQNSLRAESTNIRIDYGCNEGTGLSYVQIYDNGTGCSSIQDMLYFGESFYSGSHVAKQDPAGMGTMVLATAVRTAPVTIINRRDGVVSSVTLTEEVFSESKSAEVTYEEPQTEVEDGVCVKVYFGGHVTEYSIRSAVEQVVGAVCPNEYPDVRFFINGREMATGTTYQQVKENALFVLQDDVMEVFLAPTLHSSDTSVLYLSGTEVNLGHAALFYVPADSKCPSGVTDIRSIQFLTATVFLKDASVVPLEKPQRRNATEAGKLAAAKRIEVLFNEKAPVGSLWLCTLGLTNLESDSRRYLNRKEENGSSICMILGDSSKDSFIYEPEASCVYFGNFKLPSHYTGIIQAQGLKVSESLPVNLAGKFEQPLKVVTSASHTRNPITVKGPEGVQYRVEFPESVLLDVRLHDTSKMINLDAVNGTLLGKSNTTAYICESSFEKFNYLSGRDVVQGYTHPAWYEWPDSVIRSMTAAIAKVDDENVLEALKDLVDDAVNSPDMRALKELMGNKGTLLENHNGISIRFGEDGPDIKLLRKDD